MKRKTRAPAAKDVLHYKLNVSLECCTGTSVAFGIAFTSEDLEERSNALTENLKRYAATKEGQEFLNSDSPTATVLRSILLGLDQAKKSSPRKRKRKNPFRVVPGGKK